MPDRTQSLEARHDDLLFRRMVDLVPGLMLYLDRDLRVVFANRANHEWFGLEPGQMPGRHVREILGETVYALNQPHLIAALAGEEQCFMRTVVDQHGLSRHVEATYRPDLVEGAVQGLSVLVTDVTDRVETQIDLESAAELAGVGGWTYRPADDILTFTPQMYRIFAADPNEEPSFATLLELVHPEDLQHVRTAAEDRMRNGTDNEVQYRMIVDGEVRHVHDRVRTIRDSKGDVVMLRGAVQDETALYRQAVDLERANRLLADMMAMVGHDLRQPVTVVQGYLEQVLDDWETIPSEVLRGMVATSLSATTRLDQLLSDVLAMINLDTGKLALRGHKHDLGTLVKEIIDDVQPVGLDLRVIRSGTVLINEFHLRQVVANLITNAERYGRPPFTVSVDVEDRRASLTVADEGDGVPTDFVPQLFSRFSQADIGPASSNVGSGFGLYNVRQLVEAHGGHVTHQPNAPHGACFTVTLPLTSD